MNRTSKSIKKERGEICCKRGRKRGKKYKKRKEFIGSKIALSSWQGSVGWARTAIKDKGVGKNEKGGEVIPITDVCCHKCLGKLDDEYPS